MNENKKLAKAMEQELLAFFEQDKVKKELLKFAISDVKMVKEYGGDKAEYLALFEDQGSDKISLEESGVSYPLQERLSKETYEKYLTTVEEADEENAEYFLEENGSKYAWLASDIIYYQDLMFKLSSPFNYEQVWDNDELIELDNSAGDIISLTVNELSLFDEKEIVYQAGEGHLTNNIDEALALINKDMSEADDIYSELGEEIYNKFFEHTLDETEKQLVREYYDDTYGMEVASVIDLLKEATEE